MSDPISLPLFAVLFYAALLFPVALLLPGCNCCRRDIVCDPTPWRRCSRHRCLDCATPTTNSRSEIESDSYNSMWRYSAYSAQEIAEWLAGTRCLQYQQDGHLYESCAEDDNPLCEQDLRAWPDLLGLPQTATFTWNRAVTGCGNMSTTAVGQLGASADYFGNKYFSYNAKVYTCSLDYNRFFSEPLLASSLPVSAFYDTPDLLTALETPRPRDTVTISDFLNPNNTTTVTLGGDEVDHGASDYAMLCGSQIGNSDECYPPTVTLSLAFGPANGSCTAETHDFISSCSGDYVLSRIQTIDCSGSVGATRYNFSAGSKSVTLGGIPYKKCGVRSTLAQGTASGFFQQPPLSISFSAASYAASGCNGAFSWSVAADPTLPVLQPLARFASTPAPPFGPLAADYPAASSITGEVYILATGAWSPGIASALYHTGNNALNAEGGATYLANIWPFPRGVHADFAGLANTDPRISVSARTYLGQQASRDCAAQNIYVSTTYDDRPIRSGYNLSGMPSRRHVVTLSVTYATTLWLGGVVYDLPCLANLAVSVDADWVTIGEVAENRRVCLELAPNDTGLSRVCSVSVYPVWLKAGLPVGYTAGGGPAPDDATVGAFTFTMSQNG